MSETINDAGLLKQFADNGSPEAFRVLVARQTHLVYGCAMQRLRDAHAAADVTQAVFLALALKAKTLKPTTPLAGWLFTATRFACGKYQRSEQRRKEREMRAAEHHELLNQPDSGNAVWAEIEPQLAAAMDSLSGSDRAAVLLRFYGNATHSDLAVALRTSEVAARKRVDRALEKLQRFFTKRGVTLSATALGGLLAVNATQAAPAGLAATISQTALAGFSRTSVTTETLMLAKGALKLMFYSQLKFAAAIVAATVVVAGTSVVVAQKTAVPASTPAPLSKKLDSIVITEVEFRETNLNDAVRYLVRRSKQFDPDKTGVKIVLLDAKNPKPITLMLRNVSLREVLTYVAREAGLAFSLENETAVLRKPKATDSQSDPLTQKLESIVIPQVEFLDANINDVIQYLVSQGKQNGVTIVLRDKVTGPIHWELQNVSLHFLLTNLGLSMSFENGTVVLRKPEEKK